MFIRSSGRKRKGPPPRLQLDTQDVSATTARRTTTGAVADAAAIRTSPTDASEINPGRPLHTNNTLTVQPTGAPAKFPVNSTGVIDTVSGLFPKHDYPRANVAGLLDTDLKRPRPKRRRSVSQGGSLERTGRPGQLPADDEHDTEHPRVKRPRLVYDDVQNTASTPAATTSVPPQVSTSGPRKVRKNPPAPIKIYPYSGSIAATQSERPAQSPTASPEPPTESPELPTESSESPPSPVTRPPDTFSQDAGCPSSLPLRTRVVQHWDLNGAHYLRWRMKTAQPQKYRRRPDFSLIDAIVNNNTLMMILVSYLSIPSIIDLYAISKPFHYYFNCHATAFILASMRTWAPNADQIFPWRCYRSLCIKDPIMRQQSRSTAPATDIRQLRMFSRDVPSLRWLQMVAWREAVCKDILIQLLIRGLRFALGTRDMLKRIWFMMELPLNSQRIACIHEPTYFSIPGLWSVLSIFMKVDMAFTDPSYALYPANHPDQVRFPNRLANSSHPGCTLRAILFRERTLTPLWRVLRGWSPDPRRGTWRLTQSDIRRLQVRHLWPRLRYDPTRQHPTVLDVPWTDVGRAGLERRPAGSVAQQLIPLDELALAECIRRKCKVHEQFPEMMLWGFSDPKGNPVPLMTEEEILERQRSDVPEELRERLGLQGEEALAGSEDVAEEEQGALYM